MNSLNLIFCFALIVACMHQIYADDTLEGGDCMSLDCDAKEDKPVCGGLDADSSQGFMNECAVQIHNCLHGTEFVVQTEVECEVAFSDSATGYKFESKSR